MDWKALIVGALIGAAAAYVRVSKAKTPQTPAAFGGMG